MVCTSGSWHSVAIVYLPAQLFTSSVMSLTRRRPGRSDEAPHYLSMLKAVERYWPAKSAPSG
jgi:hypothetical protein